MAAENYYSFGGFQVPQPARTDWRGAAAKLRPGDVALVPSWDRARALDRAIYKLGYITEHRKLSLRSALYIVWNLGDRRRPLNVCAACRMLNCTHCYIEPWNRKDRPCDCGHVMPYVVEANGDVRRLGDGQ